MNVIESLKHNSYLKSLKREQFRKEIEDFKKLKRVITNCQQVMDNYKKSVLKDWMLEELSWM